MKHKPKYRKSVLGLLIFILAVSVVGYTAKKEVVTAYEPKVNQAVQEKEGLLTENQLLKEKLEASYKVNAPENIKELSRYYIKKYFGKDAPRVEKVMMCESGLSNTTINTKTGDYGLYQINARWHKARFEKMYGVKFEIGAMDFELASKYAKFLFDNSRGLSPWVCARLV